MIKQIKDLQRGDLIYWGGWRWICQEGDSYHRVIRHEWDEFRPQTLLACQPPVSVYAKREPSACSLYQEGQP